MYFGMMKSYSPVGKFLDLFHDWSLVVLMMMSFLVFSVITIFCLKSFYFKDCTESKFLEVVWTMMPGFILVLVVIPSFYGLYLLDLNSLVFPSSTMKVSGRQWYWSYSYAPSHSMGSGSTKKILKYDSYSRGYSFDKLRSVDVDLPMAMVSKIVTRIVLHSSDVIHSFTLPQLGFKVDCVPGRLKSGYLLMNHVGKFYGQCSEICGANHSFMPISVECFPENYSFFNGLLVNSETKMGVKVSRLGRLLSMF